MKTGNRQGYEYDAVIIGSGIGGLATAAYLARRGVRVLICEQHKQPGGYFLAPEGIERTGDVSNVVFTNGWVMKQDGTVFIYYGSSDTRMHVATTTIDKLLDYVINTPEDGLRSAVCVEQRIKLIQKNLKYLNGDS